MKNRALLQIFAVCFAIAFTATPAVCAEQQAQARLWCESLHFSQGRAAGDTLDLTTISAGLNGELTPTNGGNWTCDFVLDALGSTIDGSMLLELPPFVDDDGDGFDDFFQTAHSVSGTSSGTYDIGLSTGTITARWNRAALSKDGTCVLSLLDDIYGRLGDFSHTFELLEYTGTLYYTPGASTVSNRFSLNQTGVPENTFSGAYLLTKNPANQFNELFLPAGILTNTTLGELSFFETALDRELPWTTNYFGYISFQDGNLGTSEPDYYFWTLSIDDLNDANKNGIPDFSDAPASSAPVLSISLDNNQVSLRISGEIGRTNLLQEASSPNSTSWNTASTIVLTNDSQVIRLPRPQGNTFWRVLVQ